jgi:hypothetical protein
MDRDCFVCLFVGMQGEERFGLLYVCTMPKVVEEEKRKVWEF